MTLCCSSERELKASNNFCSCVESDLRAVCLLIDGLVSVLVAARVIVSCIFAACCLMIEKASSVSIGSVLRLFFNRLIISAVTELEEPPATADSKDSRSSTGRRSVILVDSNLVSIVKSMTPKRRKVLT